MYQGQTIQVTRKSGDVAELCFNAVNGSVNKFDSQTIEELDQAIGAIESDSSLKGVLVTSAKPVFIVGADIMELAGKDSEFFSRVSKLNSSNVNRLEDLSIPSVVAINGFALGGGFELCLGADFRVMSTEARVGLPETKLGLIPGWGGTVRLPRLMGVQAASQVMLSGTPLSAEKALAGGAVDAIAAPEVLLEEANEMLQQAISGELDFAARKAQKRQAVAIEKAQLATLMEETRAAVMKATKGNYPANLLVVDLLGETVLMDRDAALEKEAEAFGQIGGTPEARALIGNFINDQYISKVAKEYASRAESKTVHSAVLGAGIMGGGIAYQSALKGFPIVMKDIAQPALDLGMKEARKLTNKAVSRGKMSEQKAEQLLARIEPTLEDSDLEKVDFVVEAVVENINVKKAVLADVEKRIDPAAILTSNTSTISIDMLAADLQRPENFCGMHFFNPVHAMPLVEVIRGAKSSEQTIGRVVAQAAALGKKPIVVRDCPGFLVNRVLFPALLGFDQLLREGADIQQVDRVIEQWGWPMGPSYLSDVVGLDTVVHCLDVMADGFEDGRMVSSPDSPTRKIAAQERYGQKNGMGFYSYVPNEKGYPERHFDPAIYQLIGTETPVEMDEQTILAHYMVPLCTELARCLEEGIVNSPAEADMALLYGLGFPAFRGGVFRWLDEIGLQAFVDMAAPLADKGAIYQPTKGMLKMLAEGKTYY